MTQQTRYAYEKRIKEFSEEVMRLRQYRNFVQRLATTIGDVVTEEKLSTLAGSSSNWRIFCDLPPPRGGGR